MKHSKHMHLFFLCYLFIRFAHETAALSCRHKKVTQKRLNEMNSRRLEVIRCAHETAFGLVPRLCSDSISFIRNFCFMLRNLLIETFVNIHFVDLFSRPYLPKEERKNEKKDKRKRFFRPVLAKSKEERNK